MKKKLFLTGLTIIIACIVTLSLCSCSSVSCSDYIRIHIRANSNDNYDQEIKLKVRNQIVKYISTINGDVQTKQQMLELLDSKKVELQQIANNTLIAEGADYYAEVDIINELFPEKSYNDLTLPQGYYDALIIKLGKAEGNNWWCVAFPPLCFVAAEDNGSEKIVYKSYIKELLERLFK